MVLPTNNLTIQSYIWTYKTNSLAIAKLTDSKKPSYLPQMDQITSKHQTISKIKTEKIKWIK